ncbi:OLC1v1035068C1 [Oldenlandia corymbosa var. corymbosa]|nr:OLC1v1035068C1 [Oldenlandia corymbosa var. corymbosa]
MINRRSCFHLLLSSFHRSSSNRRLCHPICRRYFMAAAPPSTAISKDPIPFASVRKSLNRAVGLKVRGCGSAENGHIGSRNDNEKKSSGFVNGGGDGGFGGGFGLHKARVIGPHLLRELVAEEISFSLKNTTFDAGGRYRSDKGGCLGFPEDPHLGPKKFMVAVDVDEVLGNFVSALNQFIAARYELKHSVSEYHVYEFFKIWNCSRDEADLRVHEFFKTPYFKKGIYPIPGAKQALQKLSRFYDLSIVTSRQNVIKDHTIEWIEKHFPGLFQEIHFGNHFALDGKSRPKSDICR